MNKTAGVLNALVALVGHPVNYFPALLAEWGHGSTNGNNAMHWIVTAVAVAAVAVAAAAAAAGAAVFRGIH